MKFGVREIANVVFRAKQDQKIGGITFKKGQPVLYIDSAKTSNLEGAATTVYAQGGRGNARLIAWEGEKTLTFTVEDALLSPVSFAMLSGAGLLKGNYGTGTVHFHQTTTAVIGADHTIDLTDALGANDKICGTAPVYVLRLEDGGDLDGTIVEGVTIYKAPETSPTQEELAKDGKVLILPDAETGTVLIDYYVLKNSTSVTELQIDAEHFAGYYYVEADTLWRRQSDGVDLPANMTMPNVKIQSNFTFAMAASGDPSTFTFTMDALPGYTYFDRKKKVMCAIQVVDDAVAGEAAGSTVFPHPAGFAISESAGDSVSGNDESLG